MLWRSEWIAAGETRMRRLRPSHLMLNVKNPFNYRLKPHFITLQAKRHKNKTCVYIFVTHAYTAQPHCSLRSAHNYALATKYMKHSSQNHHQHKIAAGQWNNKQRVINMCATCKNKPCSIKNVQRSRNSKIQSLIAALTWNCNSVLLLPCTCCLPHFAHVYANSACTSHCM